MFASLLSIVFSVRCSKDFRLGWGKWPWLGRKAQAVAYAENFHCGVSFSSIWWPFVFGARSL